MRVKVLDQAAEDLIEGFHFYEDQQAGCFMYSPHSWLSWS